MLPQERSSFRFQVFPEFRGDFDILTGLQSLQEQLFELAIRFFGLLFPHQGAKILTDIVKSLPLHLDINELPQGLWHRNRDCAHILSLSR